MTGVTRLLPTELLVVLLAAVAALLSHAQAVAPPAPSSTIQSVPAQTSPANTGAVVEAPAPTTLTPRQPTPATRTTVPATPSSTLSPTAAPAPPSPTPTAPDSDVAPAPVAVDPRASEVLTLVNTERNQAGCDPVALEPRLSTAALQHSQDMAERGYFDHTSPDGVSPADRVGDAGYDWSGTGENIAAGHDTAQEVMDGWMNSEGHRENILNCNWVDMGMGIVDSGPDGPYWTQEFGTTSSDPSNG